jgi:hypothetical protein
MTSRVSRGSRFVLKPAQANGSVTSLRPVARSAGNVSSASTVTSSISDASRSVA